jgi:hypothetical protein
MTLEKPPRGKPVKSEFIKKLLRNFYSRESEQRKSDFSQLTYLKFSSKFVLEG